ncbi:alpha/beta hydrolase fold domain-containing protein [Micromonospora sp. CPCC 205371]|nr:alpha/beta hydrolase fold domain-containing protein [Micromonospora sp. CPCC 205371]
MSGPHRSIPAPEALELRHLRALAAVAEDLNFSRAAERLYLSQPALSRQISALERLVGCELFRRSTRRVELTAAGEALLEGTQRLLADLDATVRRTRAIGGELAARISRYWEPFSHLTVADLDRVRDAIEDVYAQLPEVPDMTMRPVNAGGVPALRLSTVPGQQATLLYLHGGGYISGSAYGFRGLAGAIAAAAGTAVVVPDYRLAPEHPYPAAVDDAERAYHWLRSTNPTHVLVAGDSSGAGLVMSLLVRLRDAGAPLPDGAALLCPWVDLTAAGQITEAASPPPIRTVEGAAHAHALYLANHSPEDPTVNPLRADLSGLPPLLVQAAVGDDHVRDAEALVDRAQAHGVDATLELHPATDAHPFQLFWSFLPEAADAVERLGAFVRQPTEA